MFKYQKIWVVWPVPLFTLIQIVAFLSTESKVLIILQLFHHVNFKRSTINIFHLKLEIASAVEQRCDNAYRMQKMAGPSNFTVNTIMSNIHCTFCNSYIELLAAIYRLRHLLENQPTVCQI